MVRGVSRLDSVIPRETIPLGCRRNNWENWYANIPIRPSPS